MSQEGEFMKILMAAAALLASTQAFSVCKDKNFEGLEANSYGDLRYEAGFENFVSYNSPMPAGLFQDYFDYDGIEICYDVQAHYFSHTASGKDYVMFTTHDDYCDGGNTYGIVVDMELYRHQRMLKDSVVAEVGDSELYCVK